MKKLIIPLLFLLPQIGHAAEKYKLSLLGQKNDISINPVKEVYIKNTVLRLLKSCDFKKPVASISPVTYKGVRLTSKTGVIIEVHIFPNSANNFRIKIFKVKNGNVVSYGKYHDYAYQLIAMMELKK